METECQEILQSFWDKIQEDNSKRGEIDATLLASNAEIKAMITEFKELYVMRHKDLSDRVSKNEEQIREIQEDKVDKESFNKLADDIAEIKELIGSKLSAEEFKAFIEDDFRPLQEKKHEMSGAWSCSKQIAKITAALITLAFAAVGAWKTLTGSN